VPTELEGFDWATQGERQQQQSTVRAQSSIRVINKKCLGQDPFTQTFNPARRSILSLSDENITNW
jgi:hypothetical protein